jgi:hypothetical protein
MFFREEDLNVTAKLRLIFRGKPTKYRHASLKNPEPAGWKGLRAQTRSLALAE